MEKMRPVEIGSGAAHGLPSWVPSYPGAEAEGHFAITGNGTNGAGGTLSFSTSDAAADVLSFYQDKIKAQGMKVQVNATAPGTGVITATDEDGRRNLTIIVGRDSGKTTVNVAYGEKS